MWLETLIVELQKIEQKYGNIPTTVVMNPNHDRTWFELESVGYEPRLKPCTNSHAMIVIGANKNYFA
jgi:hypothetical protein